METNSATGEWKTAKSNEKRDVYFVQNHVI